MENLKRVKEKLIGIKVVMIGYDMLSYLTENKKVIATTLEEVVFPESYSELKKELLNSSNTVLAVNNKNERFIINLDMKLSVSIDFTPYIDYKGRTSLKKAMKGGF